MRFPLKWKTELQKNLYVKIWESSLTLIDSIKTCSQISIQMIFYVVKEMMKIFDMFFFFVEILAKMKWNTKKNADNLIKTMTWREWLSAKEFPYFSFPLRIKKFVDIDMKSFKRLMMKRKDGTTKIYWTW